MNQADSQAHPWPLKGRFDFRFRRGVWVEASPMYNQQGEDHKLSDLIRVWLMRGIYPFLTWNLGTWFGREFKGYMGWKTINPVADKAFFWQELSLAQKHIADGTLFLQSSVRGASAVALLVVMTALPFIVGYFLWLH